MNDTPQSRAAEEVWGIMEQTLKETNHVIIHASRIAQLEQDLAEQQRVNGRLREALAFIAKPSTVFHSTIRLQRIARAALAGEEGK